MTEEQHDHCRGIKATDGQPCGITVGLNEHGYCTRHAEQMDEAEAGGTLPEIGKEPEAQEEYNLPDQPLEADPQPLEADQNKRYDFAREDLRCPYCNSPNTTHLSTQGPVQYRECDHKPGGIPAPRCIGEDGAGLKFTFKVIGAEVPEESETRMCDFCANRFPRSTFPVRFPVHVCGNCMPAFDKNIQDLKKQGHPEGPARICRVCKDMKPNSALAVRFPAYICKVDWARISENRKSLHKQKAVDDAAFTD